ncbi:hypothetical protein D3C86_944040 [compost metagenome]
MLALPLGDACDRLAVGHLGLGLHDLQVEAVGELGQDHLQVGRPLAAQDGAVRAPLHRDDEGGVFLLELGEGDRKLRLVVLGGGRDGHRPDGGGGGGHGVGQAPRGMALGDQGIAGLGLLELGGGPDVARHQPLHGELFLAHQLEEAAQALGDLALGVGEVGVGGEAARQHLEDADLAQVGIREGLEHDGDERALRFGLQGDLGLAVQVLQGRIAPFGGRRRQIDERVEQGANPGVAEGRAAHDRDQLVGEQIGAQEPGELGLCGLLTAQVAFEHLVVELGDPFDQGGVVALDQLGELRGGVRDLGDLAGLGGEVPGLEPDQVHVALEGPPFADGQLERHGVGREALVDLLEDRGIGLGGVLLDPVDEDQDRQRERAGRLEGLAGVGVHPLGRVDDEQRRVGAGHGKLGVGREVVAARHVEEVEGVVAPLARGDARLHRQLAQDLLAVEVGGGVAGLDPAAQRDRGHVEQHALDQGRLADPVGTDDGDVADSRGGAHGWALPLIGSNTVSPARSLGATGVCEADDAAGPPRGQAALRTEELGQFKRERARLRLEAGSSRWKIA